jgi:Mg-chelatase subunit ChlD
MDLAEPVAADLVALVDRFAESHPVVQDLAGTSWLGAAAVETARCVARRLVGAPVLDPPATARMLSTVAHREIVLLELMCRGRPIQAIAATVAVMRSLGRLVQEPTSVQDVDETSEMQPDELEASLRALAERKLGDAPDEDLWPNSSVKDVVVRSVAIAESLEPARMLSDAANAVEQIGVGLDALVACLPGLGWDFSVGALYRTLGADIERLDRLFERSLELRRIIDLLGRMEATQRSRRGHDRGGREDVVGVLVGGDLSDALACEIALLSDTTSEDIFYQRLVERRLICLELRGEVTENQTSAEARGPIVVCVDTSGSMQGAPEIVAKAVVLALIRRAIPSQRPVHLLLFGGPGEFVDLVIERGSKVAGRLLEFLTMGFHAGTDFDGPLLRALDILTTPEFEKADVLVITDGLCRASRRICERVEKAKAEGDFRIVSLVIGGDDSGVREFSDQVHRVGPNATIDRGIDVVDWRL